MTSSNAGTPERGPRVRMTGTQRRAQLIEIGRTLFAERGYEATSIEEIAQRAQVSKPVVYEHFGGKEGLYAVVVDREMSTLLSMITSSSLLNDAVSQVGHILAGDFSRRGIDPDTAPLYAQALVGMVSMTAQWWLDDRTPSKEAVAAHIVNLCWNGLTNLEADPQLGA
ncbi:TetR/AcrR family transcriptional regulator [Rhodococcoides corynebacterioides]|uniref:TetR/AcrR family transcriptional regulator n=1 Tax=Rhodococcoides corynebacterioides TaxID=53972 RepID=UPI00082B29E7|nr:TetR/AcrR family transcriptional regulator [Rhodococcus corynebacterioides]